MPPQSILDPPFELGPGADELETLNPSQLAHPYPLHNLLRERMHNLAIQAMDVVPDLSGRDYKGETGLMIALAYHSAAAFDIARELLRRGADPNVPRRTACCLISSNVCSTWLSQDE